MNDFEPNKSILPEARPRMARTLNRCYELKQGGHRRTLGQIASMLDCSAQGARTRLRELRYLENSGWAVNKERISGCLWEYCLSASVSEFFQTCGIYVAGRR